MDANSTTEASATGLFAEAAWFDPIEAGLRERIRGFLEELIEQELTEALGRGRYERGGAARGTGTAGGGGGWSAPSDRWRSRCRAPAWPPKTAPRGNGAAPRCPATPG